MVKQNYQNSDKLGYSFIKYVHVFTLYLQKIHYFKPIQN